MRGAPSPRVVRERVLQEIRVVARLEAVEPHVRAARLAPRERAVRHRLGHFQHEAELDARVSHSVLNARLRSSSCTPRR